MQGVITVTNREINRHLNSVLIQLKASGIAKDFDSLADAIDKLDMWDFLFNQAEVVACLHAFSVRDQQLINKLTQRRN